MQKVLRKKKTFACQISKELFGKNDSNVDE